MGSRKARDIVVGDNTFMMIPQELSDNAELELTFEDYRSGEDRTLSCPISGKIWEQGKTFIYTISLHLNGFYVELSTGAENSGSTAVTNHSPFSSCWMQIGAIGTPEIQSHYMLGWSFEKYGEKVYEPIQDILMTVPEGEEYAELFLYGVWPEEIREYVDYDY